jgi:hypothetical protein
LLRSAQGRELVIVEDSVLLGSETVSMTEWFWTLRRNVVLSCLMVKRFMDPLTLECEDITFR